MNRELLVCAWLMAVARSASEPPKVAARMLEVTLHNMPLQHYHWPPPTIVMPEVRPLILLRPVMWSVPSTFPIVASLIPSHSKFRLQDGSGSVTRRGLEACSDLHSQHDSPPDKPRQARHYVCDLSDRVAETGNRAKYQTETVPVGELTRIRTQDVGNWVQPKPPLAP